MNYIVSKKSNPKISSVGDETVFAIFVLQVF